MLRPLTWSEPSKDGYCSIEAGESDDQWRITPVPRDVTCIHYAGKDSAGTIVSDLGHQALPQPRRKRHDIAVSMDRRQIDEALNGILEQLAAIAHDRWSHWQRYLHGKGVRQANGGLLIPPELVGRWEQQIVKDYADLPETEKSDRDQVVKYLDLIKDTLSTG